MDCRDFRNKHVGFVDDTLSAVETEAMRKHRDACPACSRHDTAVRRGLLLVRNLPRVDVSPDFMVRLNDRLRNLPPVEQASARSSVMPIATFASIAAGLALVAFLGYEMTSRELTREQQPMRLAPVVATRPELPPSPVAPVFAASASTGMGVWPAVLMAGEAQMHMASLELQDSR